MNRRGFLIGIGAAGLTVVILPGSNPVFAAAPRRPMGRALGPDQTLLVYNAELVDVVGKFGTQ